MAGVTGEKDLGVRIAEATSYTLSDLISSKPLNVLPVDGEGGHDLSRLFHDELLTQLSTVLCDPSLELDVEPRHVSLARDDEDGPVLL